MLRTKQFNFDKFLLIMSECYILIPVAIFLSGWLKLVFAIVGCIILAFFAVRLFKSCELSFDINVTLFTKDRLVFWIVVAAMAAVWVYMSGIGGMCYQNGDFWARNPIFRDLSTCEWPVVYDLSKQSELVQSICGSDKVAFTYYFCWWLPVSLVVKILGLGEAAGNVLLMIWSFMGIFLVAYLLCRKLGRCSVAVPVLLVFFSGLDAIPYWWINNSILNTFPWTRHIEFWADYFQYSSNTTQLFWVFNQAIPIWILMGLMLELKDSQCSAGLAALSFAYSPWATFGMVPYAIWNSIRNRKSIRGAVNVYNLAVVILMLGAFGPFYIMGAGGSNEMGFIFSLHKGEEMRLLCSYIMFVFFEFAIYFIAMGKRAFKYDYYLLTLAELLLFPLFIIRDNNFIMRGSIPALFMAMYYVLRFMTKGREQADKRRRIRKGIVIVLVCVGAMTPLAELNRSVTNTMTLENIIEDPVVSFDSMQTQEEWRIAVIRSQFFAYDYGKYEFYKYPSE